MNDIVINVEKLGKKYSLGLLHNKTNSIRDRLISYFSGNKTENNDEILWALKDVSFQVKKGEILGIIGSNGAGKSTLLKILSCITKPTEGRARITGRVRSLLEVGTGFHNELTGRENIYLNGSILGMKKSDIDKKYNEIVDFANVDKFIDTPIKHYSTGMSMRLAFSVAAYLRSEILLIDEVLAVGDIEFQRKCLGKIEDSRNEGRTIIFISHQMSAIRTLCQDVIWMDKGKIIDKGESNSIVSAYEDKYKIRNSMSSIVTRNVEGVIKSGIFVNKVTILNSDGMPSCRIKYNESIQLLIELNGEGENSHFSIEYRLQGEIGYLKIEKNFISVGASGPFNNIYFEKDVKKIKIDIGPLPLSSGDYSLSLSIVSASERVDIWEDACSFSIYDCQPYAIDHEINHAGIVLGNTFSKLQ